MAAVQLVRYLNEPTARYLESGIPPEQYLPLSVEQLEGDIQDVRNSNEGLSVFIKAYWSFLL